MSVDNPAVNVFEIGSAVNDANKGSGDRKVSETCLILSQCVIGFYNY